MVFKNIIIGLKAWFGGVIAGIVVSVLFAIFGALGLIGGGIAGGVAGMGVAYVIFALLSIPIALYVSGTVLKKLWGWK